MGKADRLRLVREIERVRQSYVISYITSTRQNFETMMAMDAIRRFYDHLSVLGNRHARIDLFIHSNGGDGTVPWRLVTLLREYCDEFNLLVPHRAFSAATLTALGAKEIVMHPMGMLGPTDPTVTGPFNPQNPHNPAQTLGINVEDVTAYIALIKEDAGIAHEEEFVQAFNKLGERVHPLALGNVKRFLSQSRMMAEKLLTLHRDPTKEAHSVEKIVDNLTSKLYYHGHPINRREAREQVGLSNVIDASPELEHLMWSLYAEYEREMELENPFRPEFELISKNPGAAPGLPMVTPAATVKATYIESINRTDVYTMTYTVGGTLQPSGQIQATVFPSRQGWETE